jgi:hypothetical protein
LSVDGRKAGKRKVGAQGRKVERCPNRPAIRTEAKRELKEISI